MEFEKLAAFAREKEIDLTIVGMDDPLVGGIVDVFEAEGLRVFGPRKNAAILEGSKAFSKDLMKKYDIPTAAYENFDDPEKALEYLRTEAKFPIVLKADGLALGKGVLICQDLSEAEAGVKEIMEDKKFGNAGNTMVIEEFMTGREVSVLSFVDGNTIKIMSSAQDHKRAKDGDQGLNTGGMGNFSPSPFYTKEVDEFCKKYIYQATVDAMKAEGRTFKGIIFFGLMITEDGPKVLEYNARFGDPEAQVVLPRMKNDIVDVISQYVKLTRKGSSYFGLCPFHNEKTPSFSVTPSKQMYYCFGCGAGGNVYNFIMEYENYSFGEALSHLADRAGVELPKIEYSREAREKAEQRAALLEINKLAAQYFYYQLRREGGKTAYGYLTGRGLSEETIRKFGLGYSDKYSDDLYKYLKGKGYSDELLRESGLFNVDERRGMYDKFWNRVIFPIMDVNNRVIGFGGRVMGDGKPKYLNSPETKIFDKSRNLYGLNVARTTRKNYLILCEGYMDVISLHQAGFTNAVASLGTALTAGHASLIKRYVKEVYLTYDSDDAGTRAALRAVPILREAGISAKVIRMDPYKDPDEFIKNLGAEEYEKRIQAARNGFMFSLEMLEREFDMNSPEGKTEFFREVSRRLLTFEDELERNNYIEAVATAYRISRDSLDKMVAKTAVSAGMARPVVRPKRADGVEKK